MNEILNLSFIKKHISGEELIKGSFGIEWEGLRVNENGELALTPHPKIFGNKLTNPYITTDFSESQIEMITPTFDRLSESIEFFSFLADLVNTSINDDEYMWFQSMPCILPEPSKIPIARYEGSELAEESMNYRIGLSKKYGLKKQLLSGVHFNFSFKESIIEKLFLNMPQNKREKLYYKDFKNEIYLKITRNYLRYVWLVIYLTGCSVATHSTFTEECTKLLDNQDQDGGLYSLNGPSFRNASCGYKNLLHLCPDYNSVSNFTRDIRKFIEEGHISEAKELYTQIRLKPKNPRDLLNSLENDGIQYVELRTLDVNPLYKCGLVKKDMEFLHLFLIYLLIKEESDYKKWQKEALYNEEICAEFGFDPNMRLINDGEEISLKEWGLSIIEEMRDIFTELGIEHEETLDLMKQRIIDPSKTYGKRLIEFVKDFGYINSQMILAKENKMHSQYLVDETDLLKNEKFKDHVSIALQGKN